MINLLKCVIIIVSLLLLVIPYSIIKKINLKERPMEASAFCLYFGVIRNYSLLSV